MKVLLYAQNYSPRLQYICAFIFKEVMGVECTVTRDLEEFKSYNSVRINYSNSPICENEFYILPVDLLFQNNIVPQRVECFKINNHQAFFRIDHADFSFDIFAASFYLLCRYEEYLPHQKDMYGRYAHENSLAFKEGFLHLPLINIWAKSFVAALQNKFPSFTFIQHAFRFIPTYDIDIAFSYKHKGLCRNAGGFLKSPSLERIMVVCGWCKDPFDTYDWMDTLHKKFQLNPIYFFLVAAQNRVYDKNILPAKKTMWQLVKKHAEKYTIGIHPSWQSGDNASLLKQEIVQLKTISEQEITRCRQHYIRFNLPEGYRRLLNEGITDDYSMGYGSINGFRASAASAFYWFDLEKNETSSLRIHPFCFMEANAFYEQKFTAARAFEELVQYYTICKKVNGTLITIWHNNFLGTDKLYKGWGEMYESFLNKIMQPATE